MSALEIAAGIAVLAGALVQSAIGFGFALVCAPLLFAAAREPEQAVGLLLVLGVEVNLLTLAGERRRPDPLRRETANVLGWSAPGMFAGLAVLRNVSATALQIAVTIAVFASLAAQHAASRRVGTDARLAPDWAAPAVGLAAGALTTSTSTAGPPIVLLLLGRGHAPARVRDTLTTCFLGLGVLGFAALAVTGTDAALPDPTALLALAALVPLGHVAGRPVFRRIAAGHYERVLVAALTISALTGLLTALI